MIDQWTEDKRSETDGRVREEKMKERNFKLVIDKDIDCQINMNGYFVRSYRAKILRLQ